jgi:flagellar assembly factor FliW
MNVQPDLYPSDLETLASNAFSLPQGIIGFGDCRRAELNYMPEHLPFLWMKLQGPNGPINFVVLEPGGIIPNYELEVFDNDAETLAISDPSEAMVLNIVTLQQQSPLDATVNLIGPIIINRRTRIGRQVVIANYSKYSARHILVQKESPVALSA